MSHDEIPRAEGLTPYPTSAPDVDWLWRFAPSRSEMRNPLWLRVAGIVGMMPALASGVCFLASRELDGGRLGHRLLVGGAALGGVWVAGAAAGVAFARWRAVRTEAAWTIPVEWSLDRDV